MQTSLVPGGGVAVLATCSQESSSVKCLCARGAGGGLPKGAALPSVVAMTTIMKSMTDLPVRRVRSTTLCLTSARVT
jgi:hypothetical protein